MGKNKLLRILCVPLIVPLIYLSFGRNWWHTTEIGPVEFVLNALRASLDIHYWVNFERTPLRGSFYFSLFPLFFPFSGKPGDEPRKELYAEAAPP